MQGEAVALTRKEYELLLLLVKHPNRVFPREDLVVRIWGEDYEGEDRVVDLNVQRLRSKLGGTAQGWQIATVWGMGYRFEGSPP
ncbi:winged helix-turn-helix domain-containing protein [Paenibacillus sp. CC-CFT747]|nr:winged helix-turn-helix domain-containing protein [Paenibacillus sp. CC-CFT747]